MGAVEAGAAVLLDAPDAIAVVGEDVAVDLDVGGGGNEDAGAPEPVAAAEAVADDGVVANDGRIANLMEDARIDVVGDVVTLDEGIEVVDVGPEAGADVIVDEVIADDEAASPNELGAAGLPFPVEAGGIVEGDLVAVDEDVVADAGDTDLAVLLDEVVEDLHPVADDEAGAVVPAEFVGLDDPVVADGLGRRVLAVDGPVLGFVGIFFDDETAEGDEQEKPLCRWSVEA